MGKYFAHLLSLLAAVTVGALVSLLMLGLGGAVLLSGRLALMCLLFLVATAAYASVFLLLGLAASAATGRSATSLVTLMLIWAVLIVVIPQTSRLIAVTTVDTIGDGFDESDVLIDQANDELEKSGVALRPMERAQADGFDLERRYAQRYNQLDDAVIQIHRQSMRGRLDQYRRARLINSLSPGFAFQYAVEGVTANGIQRFEHFEPQAWGYLETLRQFIRDRDSADPDSPHIQLFAQYMSQAPLDHRQIPRFVEDKLTVGESIAGARGPVFILLAEALVALWLALMAFHRASIAEGADD